MTRTPERPVGKVVGRQPSLVVVIPSKAPFPWYGAIVGGERTGFDGHSITGGQRFTAQQSEQLIARGMDVLTAPAMTVRRNVGIMELSVGTFRPVPVYEFECPIVRKMADGRIRVIAPSGAEQLVEADGWTTPYRKRGMSRKAAA